LSKIWFSADAHFDHCNIILYTGRPFYTMKDVYGAGTYEPDLKSKEFVERKVWKNEESKIRCCKWMNDTLVDNWNNIVEPNDVVYHLGDFCFKRDNSFEKFTNKLNGTIVHILGNHDHNNGVKSYISKAIMEFGNKLVLAQHHPPASPYEIPEWADMVLCGHVHNYWKHKFLDGCDVPIINVGVDVWDYKPVSTNSILKYYDKLRGNKNE